MTENEEFIYESIFNQVRMGFLSTEEIKENIIEEIEDNEFDEISEEWANDLIEKEISNLQEESKLWKKPTDTDRLIKAFDELCKMNIIALHNAGFTSSDGFEEVSDVERSLRKKNRKSDGYCFYHEQDLTRAVSLENPCLYLAFQKIENKNEEEAIAVGKKIVQVLKENDFDIEWNETLTSKILIPNFKWQQLYNENGRFLLDYNDVVTLMLK